MLLHSLRAHSFRNLKPAEIKFQGGLSVFFGANGQGKTNLLEAIYVLANTKSFRTAYLGECVQHDSRRFWVSGTVYRNHVERGLAVCWQDGDKEVSVNQKNAPVLDYLGNLDAMVASLDQLPIVRGAPEQRRKFLDRGIAQLNRGYLRSLAEYHHVLRQRNRVLSQIRSGAAGVAELQPWQSIYAGRALAVSAERENYVRRLNQLLPEVVFSPDVLRLAYVPSVEDADVVTFSKTLASILREEVSCARSLRGPHRDDLKILLGEEDIRKFGSGGQQRSAVFSLLFCAIRIYSAESGELPILLIDDLDAELDMPRLQSLLDNLHAHGQVFVSTSKEALARSISHAGKWEIREGTLYRAGPP